MNLDREGREYIYWDMENLPGGEFDISFNDTDWYPMERVNDTSVRVLVAGPEAVGNPDGTPVLSPIVSHAKIRYRGTPEIVVRDAGEFVIF